MADVDSVNAAKTEKQVSFLIFHFFFGKCSILQFGPQSVRCDFHVLVIDFELWQHLQVHLPFGKV